MIRSVSRIAPTLTCTEHARFLTPAFDDRGRPSHACAPDEIQREEGRECGVLLGHESTHLYLTKDSVAAPPLLVMTGGGHCRPVQPPRSSEESESTVARASKGRSTIPLHLESCSARERERWVRCIEVNDFGENLPGGLQQI